ncbi:MULTISPECIES: hypothetical protein [Paenibacillus]|uniref:Uncharacterized protein n=1 Tax=Paenibacillus lactis TaxID=228574 RepID=A0ABS4FH00_9BACL|nr:hypothetical protein [Paenibacillus lactis]MBP1895534.1 hypothetical protein [Paenibacillus lactis]
MPIDCFFALGLCFVWGGMVDIGIDDIDIVINIAIHVDIQMDLNRPNATNIKTTGRSRPAC